jgi:hypothetical protein
VLKKKGSVEKSQLLSELERVHSKKGSSELVVVDELGRVLEMTVEGD